jgi:hypothetical protein
MSVELPISLSIADAHSNATDELNRWRGHCIDAFARMEEAAAKTLVSLPLPAGKKRPALFGERLDALRVVLERCSDAGAPKVLAALNKLQPDLEWRNKVVHATGAVYVDARGHWLWCYRFQPSKSGATSEIGTLDQKTAVAMEKRLSSDVRSISDRLRNLRDGATSQ